MTPEQRALAFDSRLSEEARVLGLYISDLPETEEGHPLPHDKLAAILAGCPNKDTVGRHMRQLIVHDYVVRTNPGGSGSPWYRWNLARENSRAKEDHPENVENLARENSRAENSLPAKIHDQKVLPAKIHGQSNASSSSSTTTTTPPLSYSPFSPQTRVEEVRSEVVEYIGREATQVALEGGFTPSQLFGIYGMYRSGGTQERFLSGVPPDQRQSVLSTALIRFTTEGHKYSNRLFEGFLRRSKEELINGRHGSSDSTRNGVTGSRGSGSDPPSAKGGTRSRSDYRIECDDSLPDDG